MYPDFNKDHECVGCGRVTDTGCGFVGDAEYIISTLHFLGVPRYRADQLTQSEPGVTPKGEITRVYRLCVGCAAEYNLRLSEGPYLSVGPMAVLDKLPAYKRPQ